MSVYESVHELIGETPLIKVHHKDIKAGVNIYAKLESYNPGGSIKDRLGQNLIIQGIKQGFINESTTIIEPTAGNTGMGLAIACIGTNIKCIFVVPKKFSQEKQQLMRALGATVINTPTEQGMAGAIAKAKELHNHTENSYLPQQFINMANPQTYYEKLGPEIYRNLDGLVHRFVAGGGSCGTFMGVSRFLKEKNNEIVTSIVQPEGSVLTGGIAGSHKTEGIGVEVIPPFYNNQFVDKVYTISDEEAFHYVSELGRTNGLLVGSSSGAAFSAAIKESLLCKEGENIVTIFPDSSERYISCGIYEERL